MSSPPTCLDQIVSIFNLFHDGTIAKWEGDLTKLSLTIECDYLAQLPEPKTEKFTVILFNLSCFRLEFWEEKQLVSGMGAVELLVKENIKLEILSAKKEGDSAKISCLTDDSFLVGSNVFFNADKIQVLNFQKMPIEITHLTNVAKEYWRKFNLK